MYAIETINGVRTKTQTIVYPSTGGVTKRIFDNITDVVPSDIIVVTVGKHIGKAPVSDIEHPEAVLYKHHYEC